MSSHSSSLTSSSRRTRRQARVYKIRSASQMKSIERAIRRGPMTIVLVYSPTCPHCHTYMPIWDKLSSQKGRKANLVSMEASTYQQTSLSEKKPVQSVPTVLFIDANGKIVEAKTPRNEEVMSTAVKHGVHETEATTITESPEAMTSSKVATTSQPGSDDLPVGTRISENPLIPIPGTPIKSSESEVVQMGGYRQVGGSSPWSAFMSMAQQAAPAALLLGAYALSRSSGLPATTRKRRRYRH